MNLDRWILVLAVRLLRACFHCVSVVCSRAVGDDDAIFWWRNDGAGSDAVVTAHVEGLECALSVIRASLEAYQLVSKIERGESVSRDT